MSLTLAQLGACGLRKYCKTLQIALFHAELVRLKSRESIEDRNLVSFLSKENVIGKCFESKIMAKQAGTVDDPQCPLDSENPLFCPSKLLRRATAAFFMARAFEPVE